MNNTEDYKYVGFWKRVLAIVIDFVILIPLLFILFKVNLYAIQKQHFWLLSTDIIIYSIYNVYFISTRGGTPGKLIIKISVVNEEGMFISPWKAILRYSPLIVQNILAILVRSNTKGHYIFNFLYIITGLFTIIDVLIIPFNKKKRAIHDYIAGSFVISKDSTEICRDNNIC